MRVNLELPESPLILFDEDDMLGMIESFSKLFKGEINGFDLKLTNAFELRFATSVP